MTAPSLTPGGPASQEEALTLVLLCFSYVLGLGQWKGLTFSLLAQVWAPLHESPIKGHVGNPNSLSGSFLDCVLWFFSQGGFPLIQEGEGEGRRRRREEERRRGPPL